MKKILILSTVLAVASWSLVSCTKQTDTKVVDSQTGSSGNSGGFNWTGSEPMSAKINGVPWLATTAMLSGGGAYYAFGGQSPDAIISVSVPANASPGKIYSLPAPAGVSGAFPTPLALISVNGKVKIVTNNSSTIEGYFYADLKDPQGLTDTVVHITEGYFKIAKP